MAVSNLFMPLHNRHNRGLQFIGRKGLVYLSFWVCLLLAYCTMAQAQTPVRIVAANITSGNNQDYQAQGTRILQGLSPDIVLIQEFNIPGTNNAAGVSSWVSSTFGAGFAWYREPGNQSIPNGIISRYPIIEAGEWDDTLVPDRDFAWARIDVPGPKDLWAVSVHLKTSSASTQNAQVQLILNAMQAKGIPSTDYVVIGGDFNTSSRTSTPMTTLDNSTWNFATAGPYPVGENGDGDTNAGRSSPYDWVVPSAALNGIKTSTVYLPRVNASLASKTYANGLVMDTRDFSQGLLNEYFPPALQGDSGVTGMQHMAVVRTFLFPGAVAPPADGTVATVSIVDKTPAQVQAGTEAAMLGITVSVSSAEWDGASLGLQRTGALPDAQVTAKVYQDLDNSGTITGADQLLGSSVFSGGLSTVALGTPAPRATSGQPIRLLVSAAVAAGATNGSTVQVTATANGLASAASGGTDPNPVYSAFASGEATVTNEPPPPPPPVGAAVVVNKWLNGVDSADDTIELLVVQDGLDMRGMILKDFSGSMANDNGGRHQFSSNSVWGSVRAGTLIVLRNNATAADTTATGADFKLDVGIDNTTYFILLGGDLNLANAEMVTIKAAGSGATGSNQAVHSLACGAAGVQYTAAPAPKLISTTGAGNGEYLVVTNTGLSGDSRLANFDEGGGTAAVATSGITFGLPNNTANANFINLLRGTNATPATAVQDGQFTANWQELPAAASYRLDVARDSAFSSYVAGYSDLNTGTAASYTIDGLSEGTYYFRVRGIDADGTQGRSSNTIAVNLPIASPSELAATAVDSATIQLVWVDNSSRESGYRIEHKRADEAGFTVLATLASDTNEYVDANGLAADKQYCYRLSAFDVNGSSGFSNTACATTPGGPHEELVGEIPHPGAAGDLFGYSVAKMTANKQIGFVIGAPGTDDGVTTDAGRAYVYYPMNQEPALVVHNPLAGENDRFGHSVAAIGDSLLIGAPSGESPYGNGGRVYLFSAVTGELQKTFASPAPHVGEQFGWSVSAMGKTDVVVGAPGSNRAYLFSLKTGAVRAIEDPNPAAPGRFGHAVAGGKGKLGIVDAAACSDGSASFFTKTVVHYANAEDAFSISDANGKFLIGAPLHLRCDGSAPGYAYLHTGKSLKMLFTSPNAGGEDGFGYAVGGGKKFVGFGAALYDETSALDAGRAYVYRVKENVPAATYPNPAPSAGDKFGYAIAVAEKVLLPTRQKLNVVAIGAPYSDNSAPNAGTVYLYEMPLK